MYRAGGIKTSVGPRWFFSRDLYARRGCRIRRARASRSNSNWVFMRTRTRRAAAVRSGYARPPVSATNRALIPKLVGTEKRRTATVRLRTKSFQITYIFFFYHKSLLHGKGALSLKRALFVVCRTLRHSLAQSGNLHVTSDNAQNTQSAKKKFNSFGHDSTQRGFKVPQSF